LGNFPELCLKYGAFGLLQVGLAAQADKWRRSRLQYRQDAAKTAQGDFFMDKRSKVRFLAMAALAFVFLVTGCATYTNYLHIITPHNAADLLADNVQVFEGATYDEAAVLAAEAGYEVILSYEGRGRQGLFAVNASVRLIAKDEDGIRPAAGE
jgi:hypothetical protein